MKVLITILIFYSVSLQIAAQTTNAVLAKIGDKVITVDEFKYRYEFTPQIDRKYNDDGKAKEELLYTLIAEKLFSIEAENKGLDTSASMKSSYVPLKKMYVRDGLYKQEISDKVEFDINKFNEGLARADFKLFVDYVYSKNKDAIFNAYEELKGSVNFDSTVVLLKDVEYVRDPYEVTYGKMYVHAENAIYNLNLNDFTEPIESPEGWYVFRLVSKIPAIYNSRDQKTSMVKKVVEGRIEDSIYNDYWKNFFTNQKVTTDGSLFWYLTDELHKVIIKITNSESYKPNEKIVVTNEDFKYLKNNLSPDSLKKVFIKFEENPLTLEDFLRDFSFEGFYTLTTDKNTLASQLNSRIKRQIELELLTRQAFKKGVSNLPEVKNSIDIWRDNYLATLLKRDIVLNTELTDAEINEYFEKESGAITETQVNVIEILTDSLEVIKEALKIADNSDELKKFAKIHTRRNITKANGGEFGYFSIYENGEIGKIASSMEVGDVYGPLEIDGGYSVFKLVGKKENKIEGAGTAITEEVKTRLKYKKIVDQLENLAVDLAEKYNLTVNSDLLKSINALNAQMVVFRYMGFGGRIQAFPYSSPFYEWKEKWEQKKKDLL